MLCAVAAQTLNRVGSGEGRRFHFERADSAMAPAMTTLHDRVISMRLWFPPLLSPCEPLSLKQVVDLGVFHSSDV